MLLSSALIDGSAGRSGLTCAKMPGMVDEILQQVALIFGQEEDFGLLDDIAKVSD